MSLTTTLPRRKTATGLRFIAEAIRARFKARLQAASLRRLDRHLLDDIGVTELPNGLFVKLELNRRIPLDEA